MTSTPIPTDEDFAERRRLYARHQPVNPLRQSRVPGVLQDHPEFRKLAGERAAVQEAEARIDREHSQLAARNEVAKAEHQRAQREALLRGAPAPPPLQLEPWLHAQHTKGLFDDLHAVLEANELCLLEEEAQRWATMLQAALSKTDVKLERVRADVQELESHRAPYAKALDQIRALAAQEARRIGEDRRVSPTREDQETYISRVADGAVVRQIQQDFEEIRRQGGSTRARSVGRR